jgi:TolB-like protein
MRWFALLALAVFAAISQFSPIIRADSPPNRPQQIAIAVKPFAVLGDGSRAWVGKALQEGVVSDLEQRGYQAVDGSAPADFVVTGSVQIIDDQLRIAGRISTGADDKTVGRFHSDGNLRDLFSIEDSLSSKADRLMIPPKPVAAGAVRAAPAATLTLVGASLPSPSRYFDGNLAATLAIKDQFTDEEYRYNYRPTQFYCGYYPFCYGYFPYGGYPYFYGPVFGIRISGSPAATISGW